MTKEELSKLSQEEWNNIYEYIKNNETYCIKLGKYSSTSIKRKDLYRECESFIDFVKEKGGIFEEYTDKELKKEFKSVIKELKLLRKSNYDFEQKKNILNVICKKLHLFIGLNQIEYVLLNNTKKEEFTLFDLDYATFKQNTKNNDKRANR
jgi:hypothetical protein